MFEVLIARLQHRQLMRPTLSHGAMFSVARMQRRNGQNRRGQCFATRFERLVPQMSVLTRGLATLSVAVEEFQAKIGVIRFRIFHAHDIVLGSKDPIRPLSKPMSTLWFTTATAA